MSAISALLDELSALLPPPTTPFMGSRSWQEVFAELGTELPADFVALIERYGNFHIVVQARDDHGRRIPTEYLSVRDPRAERSVSWAQAAIYHAERFQALPPFDRGPNLWPAPGGFLGWGTTTNGEWLGWLTQGPSDEWPVAMTRSGDRWLDEVAEISATEFLVNWLTGVPDFELPDLSADSPEAPIECRTHPLS
ncbi:hypothetical protein [Actinomadura kijaniata]|uniref:hypothetical protein n=1 Tax=Actinomadura kijaniata TaxID=46161 RepID=UPI00082B28D5|nr:hypothetical protein [Actinomadura kijaniata]